MNRYVQRLRELAAAYRAAEVAIIAAFFRKVHRKKDHLRWLSLRRIKNTPPSSPSSPRLPNSTLRWTAVSTAMISGADAKTRRRNQACAAGHGSPGRYQTQKNHLCRPAAGWLRTKNSPGSARAVRRVTRHYCTGGTDKTKEIRRQDEALERAAITITEGGGGALYLVCSKLKRLRGKNRPRVQGNPAG